MRHYFTFLFILFLLISCQSENNDSKYNKIQKNTPKIDTISYLLTQVNKKLAGCDQEDQPCATAAIHYINIQDQNHAPINNILKDSLRGNAPAIDTQADSILREMEAFFVDFTPPEGMEFTMEIKQKVINNKAPLLVIQENTYSYTGGAHGNYFTSFYNFNTSTNTLIELEDLFVENYQIKLEEIAEQIFRKNYLKAGEISLSDAGFWFENEQFLLSDAFALTPEGLLFLYNIYEIAPYAMGQQEVLIPFDKLQELIRKDGVLAKINRH